MAISNVGPLSTAVTVRNACVPLTESDDHVGLVHRSLCQWPYRQWEYYEYANLSSNSMSSNRINSTGSAVGVVGVAVMVLVIVICISS